jgi:hypothetical protein
MAAEILVSRSIQSFQSEHGRSGGIIVTWITWRLVLRIGLDGTGWTLKRRVYFIVVLATSIDNSAFKVSRKAIYLFKIRISVFSKLISDLSVRMMERLIFSLQFMWDGRVSKWRCIAHCCLVRARPLEGFESQVYSTCVSTEWIGCNKSNCPSLRQQAERETHI